MSVPVVTKSLGLGSHGAPSTCQSWLRDGDSVESTRCRTGPWAGALTQALQTSHAKGVLSSAPTRQGSASVKGAEGGQQEWGDRDKGWALHPSTGSRKGSVSAEAAFAKATENRIEGSVQGSNQLQLTNRQGRLFYTSHNCFLLSKLLLLFSPNEITCI